MDCKGVNVVKLRVFIGILVVIGVLAGMSAGVQAQEEGLVAEWHFDEGEGSVLKDSSGNGNDGVIYGAIWVEGKYGKALSFDGVDDYVSISTDSGINPVDSSWTIEAWINVPTIPPSDYNYHVLAKHDGDMDNGYALFLSNDGNVYYMVDHYKGPVYKAIGVISTNSWYHVTGVLDRSTNNLKMFVNGDQTGSFSISGLGAINPANPLWIGRYNRESRSRYEYFNGIIDEVRIYKRALSPDEIDSHYEHGPTALSLTKTATPNSIKQGQTTTITLTVKNTGSTDIRDIEIADTVPSDLILIDGETSKIYGSLSPKDSRQFQYVLQFDEAGTFNLAQATASYADDEGNYKTVKSKPASVEVIPFLISNSVQNPSNKPNSNVYSASVNLHGEKTDVVLGEDVLLKLSAVNIIGNPIMHVQVIIIPPSGWSVTSSEFAKSGAGQYTTTYELESGGGKNIEVRIVPNQIGDDFQVEGRIIYYFGDDLATREDHTLNLPITVRAKPDDGQKPSTDSEESKTPGFGVLVAVIGLLMTAYLIKRK